MLRSPKRSPKRQTPDHPLHRQPLAAGQSALAEEAPGCTRTEAAQLRVRVIALENLVVALLADASPYQRTVAVAMGGFISPRPGCTPHPLTLRAAGAMDSLLGRAERFRPAGQRHRG